jgi:Protein of unknown function (DUF1572)
LFAGELIALVDIQVLRFHRWRHILAHGAERQQGMLGARCAAASRLRKSRSKAENQPMPLEFTTSYLKDSIDLLRYYKRLGAQAIAQVPDEFLAATPDPESNSIALIVKHLAGNMRSRWPDFLTVDGEKPGRDRDAEFVDPPLSRAEISAMWEAGWTCVFDALAPLTDSDLDRVILIRGERHSVMQAINRQLAHYAYHIGQIVYVARHFCGIGWTSLSIPRGKSADFNARVSSGKASQR